MAQFHHSGGIIPACAGSTRRSWSSTACSGDHPRMCGEHSSARMAPSAAGGSSPHVRGALAQCVVCHDFLGIIPACAGSTDIDAIKRLVAGDHPRMCGEHLDGDTLNNVASGSSPHVRGALATMRANWPTQGIIPACAGSTSWAVPKPRALWDHPRMCGEHRQHAYKHTAGQGSSPHVRGAPNSRRSPSANGRIIPACAGST